MAEATAREVSKAGKMFLGKPPKTYPIKRNKVKVGTKLLWDELAGGVDVNAFSDWLTEHDLKLETVTYADWWARYGSKESAAVMEQTEAVLNWRQYIVLVMD